MGVISWKGLYFPLQFFPVASINQGDIGIYALIFMEYIHSMEVEAFFMPFLKFIQRSHYHFRLRVFIMDRIKSEYDIYMINPLNLILQMME